LRVAHPRRAAPPATWSRSRRRLAPAERADRATGAPRAGPRMLQRHRGWCG
jgi:hypothetical protein